MKLSVIIPTLNEVGSLGETIGAVRERAQSDTIEIIVSDCGSIDGTTELVRALGVRLIEGNPPSKSRAEAINRAVPSASGDVLWFLDADTIPPFGFDHSIEAALQSTKTVGGAFEFALEGPGWKLRIVELINRIRYRFRQRFYSDQGIFCRTEAFQKVGGYPMLRIMEAAYFCKRLRGIGRLQLIKTPIPTSARRFLNGGIFRVLALDVQIWATDLLGFSVESFAPGYQADNHERGLEAIGVPSSEFHPLEGADSDSHRDDGADQARDQTKTRREDHSRPDRLQCGSEEFTR